MRETCQIGKPRLLNPRRGVICRSDRHPVSSVRPEFAARSTFGETPARFLLLACLLALLCLAMLCYARSGGGGAGGRVRIGGKGEGKESTSRYISK